MSDEPRGGPSALRAPRGRGREENLRAAVVAAPDGSSKYIYFRVHALSPLLNRI